MNEAVHYMSEMDNKKASRRSSACHKVSLNACDHI